MTRYGTEGGFDTETHVILLIHTHKRLQLNPIYSLLIDTINRHVYSESYISNDISLPNLQQIQFLSI